MEVARRPLERRSDAARESSGDGDAERLDGALAHTLEHQVDEEHGEPDENGAVQVAPERQQRDDEPDGRLGRRASARSS